MPACVSVCECNSCAYLAKCSSEVFFFNIFLVLSHLTETVFLVIVFCICKKAASSPDWTSSVLSSADGTVAVTVQL